MRILTILCAGFVWFVLSLVKKYYLRQFSLFAWTHVALLCVVTQSYLIVQNMFQVTSATTFYSSITTITFTLIISGSHLVHHAYNDGDH